jgi:hypothetical protein
MSVVLGTHACWVAQPYKLRCRNVEVEAGTLQTNDIRFTDQNKARGVAFFFVTAGAPKLNPLRQK